jgi:hypothetical protein
LLDTCVSLDDAFEDGAPSRCPASVLLSLRQEVTMVDRAPAEGPSNMIKDPDEWKTGDEPMTGAQASYLKTLSDEAGEPFSDGLTKAEASKRIDELQEKTGRGVPDAAPARKR